MPYIRLATLALAVVLVADKRGGEVAPTIPDEGRFQGTWEILSVHYNGEPAPDQIGSPLTFAGAVVKFQPKVVQIADGTS